MPAWPASLRLVQQASSSVLCRSNTWHAPACAATPRVQPTPAQAAAPPALSPSRSLEAFLPGTPFFLLRRMGWRCLLGFAGLLPGALLLSRRTQGW